MTSRRPAEPQPPLRSDADGSADGVASAPAESGPQNASVQWRRPAWLAAALVALVAVGLVVIATSESNAPPTGERTARLAAQRYVTAVDAGDKTSAVTASCASYADEARAEATSGSDPGISFRLGAVRVNAAGVAATAAVTEWLQFKDATQHVRHELSLHRQDGRWLVCGQQ